MKNHDPHLDEYARARLAYVTAGRPPLVLGPRHLADQRDAEPTDLGFDDDAGWSQEPQVHEPGAAHGPVLRRAGELARGHVKAIAAVLLAALVLTALVVQRSRPTTVPLEEVPVTLPTHAATAPSVGASLATPSAAATPDHLKVHVLGAVVTPGVVRLRSGARVQDAVTAAGGLAGSAAIGELNLAAPVMDGDQVLIGTRRRPRGVVRHAGETAPAPLPSAAAGSAGASGGAVGGGVLDLNNATAEQLDTLPGVGPVTAQRILEWRTSHGRFSRVEELQEVDGIGPKTYANLSSHVRV